MTRYKVINEEFNLALSLHERGEFNAARGIYQSLTCLMPESSAIIGLMGVSLTQQGLHDAAMRHLKRALVIDPFHAATRSNLGNACRGMGCLLESLDSLRASLVLAPDFDDALRNYGISLGEAKQNEVALSFLRRAVRINPQSAEITSVYGVSLLDAKRYEEAMVAFNKAISLKPDYPEAYMNRGCALQKLKRHEEALKNHDWAIVMKPDFPEAHMNRGNVLQELKRFDEALISQDQAIELKTDFAEAHLNRANALRELKKFEDAVTSYDWASELKSDLVEAHVNRGNTLVDLQRFEDALSAFDRAIDLEPDSAEAHSNRGIALGELQRFEEALSSYDQAINLKADYADAYWNKSLLLILLGRYVDGYGIYHWRFETEDMRPLKFNRKPNEYQGQEVSGKRIHLYPEQGLGDSIQFSRYAKLLSDRGAQVFLEVPRQLSRLMNTLDPRVVILNAGEPIPEVDYSTSLMSLPQVLGTTVETIPWPGPYLHPLGPSAASKKSRIGVVWSGNPKHKNDANRSIPLELFSRIFALGYSFVALQKGIREEDRTGLRAISNVLVIEESVDDFADTANVIDDLDLIISVDTSVAHLSGAMGKETWILLPFMPDYRWMLGRDDTPWYPSAKLYRQDKSRAWEPLVERLIADLQKRYGKG